MLDVVIKVAYLSAIFLSLFTSGWLLVKADRNRITGSLVSCQLLIIIWCVPQLFSSLPMTVEMKYLMYGISYIGITFIGPAWLEFAFLYSRKRLGRAASVLLFGVAAVNYSILLTNEYHHLFYRSFGLSQVVYGPVFYLHMVFTYLCVLGGIAVVLAAFKRNLVARGHIVIILLSAAVPLLFNLLYISGLVQSGFDLTPPSFAFSSLFMLLAVFRYDFLDINTMAFGDIFDSISEAVVVYNRRAVITYCNHTAKSWFGIRSGDTVEALLDLLKDSGFAVDLDSFEDPQAPVLDLGCAGEPRKLEVKQSDYRDQAGRLIAHALMFTDVGRYYQLLEQGEELAISNQRLAIEQERNRIAQEVHDTAGHTLTMINSLMKLSRIEYGKLSRELPQSEQTDEEAGNSLPSYLEQAQEMAGTGIRELRCSINNLRQAADGSLITHGVRQLARSVREIEVDVEIQGEDQAEYSHLSPVVYECVREAVTNCLKYAGATHMDIILKFADSFLHLYIFDNGRGCNVIKEGNGIRGIRERVRRAGGEVRFISETGEGFQISIRFPF